VEEVADNIALGPKVKEISGLEMLLMKKVRGDLTGVKADGVIGFTPKRMRVQG
jgi:hypothetical protein